MRFLFLTCVILTLLACGPTRHQGTAGPQPESPSRWLSQLVDGKKKIKGASASGDAYIVDFVAFPGNVIVSAVQRGDSVVIERTAAVKETAIWDMAAEGKVFVAFSNVIGSSVLIASVDKGCEWECEPSVWRYDELSRELTKFATVTVENDEYELDANNRPEPGTASPGGHIAEDHPTLCLLQTETRAYVWMLTTAYTLKLVILDSKGSQLNDKTIMPKLAGRGGVYALNSLIWATQDGIGVTLSNFEDYSEVPESRRLIDRYADYTDIPLSGEAIGVNNLVLVHLTRDGVIKENRVINSGKELVMPTTVVSTGTDTVFIANEWSDATGPRLITVTKNQATSQSFTFSENKNNFEDAVLLPSGDLLVGLSYDFKQARTGSVTKDDDALLVRLRKARKEWKVADRIVFSSTAKRDTIRGLQSVEDSIYVLDYSNGPLTHDKENNLEATIWRL